MRLDVAITGATGYLGRALSTLLLARGHRVRALVRRGGAPRVMAGANALEIDVFDVAQMRAALQGADAVVHLIGTPHPNPGKAAQFLSVDLASARVCAQAAAAAKVGHFVYVSVAQPAPVMHEYVDARRAAEAAIVAAGLTATFVRPWYVLGPGHRWPYLLLPFYALARVMPGWRETARRLGLVTLAQMTRALAQAVESPPAHTQICDVPQIRDVRVELRPEVLDERHPPHLLAAGGLGGEQGDRQPLVGGEERRVPAAETERGRAGERREIDHHLRIEFRVGVGEGVGQDHPPLGVGVDDLDGAAPVVPHDVAGAVGGRTDRVLGERQ